jgi:arginine/ornithine N-succinyltransferase beta subunit
MRSGRHFFGIDFGEADRLSVVNKKFIADLMPDHPIYIPLLAEDCAGRHRQAAPREHAGGEEPDGRGFQVREHGGHFRRRAGADLPAR